MTSLGVLIPGLICLFSLYAVAGISSNYGKIFIVAVPSVKDMSIECFFSTLRFLVQVNITSNYFKVPMAFKTIVVHVRRFNGSHQSIGTISGANGTGIDISYLFQGNDTFGLIVMLMAGGEMIMDALYVLPVEGWGRTYYVITSEYQPTVHIVTYQDMNEIYLVFKDPRPEFFENLQYSARKLAADILNVVLDHYETFTLSVCYKSSVRVKSLSGMIIVGEKPIGVISGNCYSTEMQCSKRTNHYHVAAEMLMPKMTFGREFVTVNFPAHGMTGHLQVLTATDETVVRYYMDDGLHKSIQIKYRQTEIFIRNAKNVTMVWADKHVQLAYVFEHVCPEDYFKFVVSMCILVPIELYYDVYTWRLPETHETPSIIQHYAALVIKDSRIVYLRFNEAPISSLSTIWYEITSNDQVDNSSEDDLWTIMHLKLHVHDCSVYDLDVFKFGCYLYGIGVNSYYNTPAGFVSSIIYEECQKSKPKYGDGIDNDCDGFIDEELEDGADNDSDGLTDEDLNKLHRTDGGWGPWSPWECTRNCSDTDKIRRRLCDNPKPADDGLDCTDQSFQYKPSDCYTSTLCPSICPQGYWAANCVRTCPFCEPDCDKFTGACKACKAGKRKPENFCTDECEEYTYGVNCTGSCIERCRGDCHDRSTGTCWDATWEWLNYLLILPLLLFIWLVLWSTRTFIGTRNDINAKLNTDNNDDSSSMNSGILIMNGDGSLRLASSGQLYGKKALESLASTSSSYSKMESLASYKLKTISSTNTDDATLRKSDVDAVTPQSILIRRALSLDGQVILPVIGTRSTKSVSFADEMSSSRPNTPSSTK